MASQLIGTTETGWFNPGERWDEVARIYNTICMIQPVRTVEAAYPVTT